MDALLDKVEELPPVTTQVPATTASHDSTPPVSETLTTSPVPIVDSEILNAIPSPEEVVAPPKSEDLVIEPTIESTTFDCNNAEDEGNQSDETNAQNKLVWKYSFKEDQWSPLNPEGKKEYDREFLLQLQSQPMSLCKPSNFPNLGEIKDKPHPAINRRSQLGRYDKKRKNILLPTKVSIQLHEVENAWRPSYKEEQAADESAAEMADLTKKFLGILNKVPSQTFESLVKQVKSLNIDTEVKLQLTIDLMFEKALNEPNFTVPCVLMCIIVDLISKLLDRQPGQSQFQKLLLTKCQKEFELDRSQELQREDRIKAIEAADPDKRKELLMEFDEIEKKMFMRQLGNIRFMGELFKLKLPIEPIMHECIKKLIMQGDEESLECLCCLLITIGKKLDDKGNENARDSPNPMDQYFANMQKIVDRKLTSSRVRFMLQGVIDLKKNNWIPIRDENNSETIDQIHKEAGKEAGEAEQVYQNMPYPNKQPRIKNPQNRRKISGRNEGVSEDGWRPTFKSSKGSYNMVDPSKLKLTKPDEVDSIRLGTGGRGPQSWGKGSSGGNRSTNESDKTALTNRYAASSSESSRDRDSQLPSSVRKTPSTSKERENSLETVKGLSNENIAELKPQEVKKVDNQLNGKAAETLSAMTLNGPELSKGDIKKKTKLFIVEFLHNADFEEAVKCVTELASPKTVHYFIYCAVNRVLRRSSQDRCHLGQLLCSLVKKEIITLEQYKKGLTDILKKLDEYALGTPLIWEYMGEILEAIVEDHKLAVLSYVLEPLIPSKAAGKLVSNVIHILAKKKVIILVGEIWKESGLTWESFIGEKDEAEKFVNDLNYFPGDSVQRTVPNMDRNPMQQVVNQAPRQPTSQYSHAAVYMMPSHPLNQKLPPTLVMNHGTLPQMYTPGRPYQPSYQVISPNQPMHANNRRNYYSNPHPTANGHYEPQMPRYPMSPPVNTQQTPATTQPVKKKLAIIDPETGKNILEAVNDDTPPQKEEPNDDSICIQFATQIAQALGTKEKTEPTLKTSPIESSRIVQATVPSSAEVEVVNNVDEMDTYNDECEQFVVEDDSSTPYYSKDNDVNNVAESLESKPIAQEIETDDEPAPPIYNVSSEEVPIVKGEEKIEFPEQSIVTVEKPTPCIVQDTSSVSASDRVSPERTEEPVVSTVVVEEDGASNVESIGTNSNFEVQ